ncbi:MAG: heme-copper oxidase subunit III [Gemmatimonadales bacterium]
MTPVAHSGAGTVDLPGPGDDGGRREGPYPVGLMGVLATVSMLFAAFTAALLVRRTGTDWASVDLPAILWANTVVLALSSLAVEMARAAARREESRAAAVRLRMAWVLGLVFLAGQIVAWRILAGQNVFLPTSPHAAFFYMLSAVHGLHVVGGLAALACTAHRAASGAYTGFRHGGMTHAAIYWHFVGGVWTYLLVLLLAL